MPFVCMILGPYGDQRDEEPLKMGSPLGAHAASGAAQGPAGAEGIKLGFPCPELALS